MNGPRFARRQTGRPRPDDLPQRVASVSIVRSFPLSGRSASGRGTMSQYRRREFLADVGKGMLVASVGSVLAQDLALAPAALAEEGAERLTFGAMEPLAALMQESPADRLLPALMDQM